LPPAALIFVLVVKWAKGGIIGNEGETLITPIMEGDDSPGKNVEI